MTLEQQRETEKHLSRKFKEKCIIIPPNLEVCKDRNLQVITKDDFIIQSITDDKEDINKMWDDISGGFNFAFIDNDGRYLSVNYLNGILRR